MAPKWKLWPPIKLGSEVVLHSASKLLSRFEVNHKSCRIGLLTHSNSGHHKRSMSHKLLCNGK
ncbi:hypothetical protein C5167_015947 [Papaver somniferum]|nr:hypothetical protein C5167_015947 [Papaver somniferum]